MERSVLVQGVSREYRQGDNTVCALTDISLTIGAGEFLCIVGPSGSGKTTLLNLIGGLDEPTRGDIFVGGNKVNGLSRSEVADLRLHHIGFIFQAFNLIPVLSARENVEFVMELRGIPASERRARAMDILRAVGLKGMEERRPGYLSGGQQQRVAVARAIVGSPDIVLADEPTANLDSRTAEGLLVLMREMSRERGITFIFSTHDALVMEYAEREVRLRDGRVEFDSGMRPPRREGDSR